MTVDLLPDCRRPSLFCVFRFPPSALRPPPLKQAGQQRHVAIERRGHRFDAKIGFATKRLVVAGDRTQVPLLDAMDSARPEGLLNLGEKRAGQQRLRRFVERRIAQVEPPRRTSDGLIEQQHFLAGTLAAGDQRQAGVDQPQILGLAVEAVLALGRRKRLFRQPSQEQIGKAKRSDTGRRDRPNLPRLIAGVADAIAADDV